MFAFADHGSITILTPLNDDATAWIEAHLPADVMHWGGGVVIELRYAQDILDGIVADGLEVA